MKRRAGYCGFDEERRFCPPHQARSVLRYPPRHHREYDSCGHRWQGLYRTWPITPGTSADHVPAGTGPVVVATLSGDGNIPLGNGSDVGSDSPRQIVGNRNAGPSTAVNTRLKLVYDAPHPDVLIQASGRNRFSFAYSRNVAQKKSTVLPNRSDSASVSRVGR
jgi:hypothetical protein